MSILHTLDTIKARRSIRKFENTPVKKEDIDTILDAGRWAPSGLNNQPWRYIVIQNKETIKNLSTCTHYSEIVEGAPLLIAVYLYHEVLYNYVKDILSIGASIENMLLACHELGLGAVWLGEILNQAESVNTILETPESFELMAVVAIGHPAEKSTSERKEIHELVYSEKFGNRWIEENRDEEY